MDFALLVLALPFAASFAPATPLAVTLRSSSATLTMEYIPDGLSKAEWTKIKSKEAAAKKGLGKIGARGFKSRSMESFQKAMEAGEATHLLPVFDAKKKVRKTYEQLMQDGADLLRRVSHAPRGAERVGARF